MKEILFIAPFEELASLAKQVIEIKKYDNIDVLYIKTELFLSDKGMDFIKSMIHRGTKIIISRGGAYTKIKEAFDIPVVEMTNTSTDLLKGFQELIDFKGKIGVVGYEHVISGSEIIGRLLKLNIIKIQIDTQNEKQAEALMKRHVDNGVDLFLGDSLCSLVAKKINCKSYTIRSGEESIINSMDEAGRILVGLRKEKENAEKLKTIINFIDDGIIAINDEGRITIFNSAAEKIFGISQLEVIGETPETLLKRNKLNEILKSGEMKLGEVIDLKKSKIVSNTIPIIVDDRINGVVATFQDVTKIQDLEQKVRLKLRTKGFIANYTFDDIVQKSDAMKSCIHKAKIYSKYDSPVLIIGKSGAGKELFAQSIHNDSNRKNGPFVAINCGALPPNLIESVFFGYTEGAFTGASKGGKAGVFELAHGGTIFLDEIGEIPLEIQSRLLRIIQEREVMRIGDDKVIPVDVRIITATNRNLKEMINAGSFREDLYFRINILSLLVPEISDRREDIPVLAKFFIEKYSTKYSKKIEGISRDAENYLSTYNFRGNVRELEGIIERAVILCTGSMIQPKDIIEEKLGSRDTVPAENNNLKLESFKSLKEIEDKYIDEVIEHCCGNLKDASKILKVNRTTLWRKRKKDA